MNKCILAWLTATIAVATVARGQGTFQNLDFEAAHLPGPGSSFATSNALPGWSAFAGTNPLTSIAYDWVGSVPEVGLYDTSWAVIAGRFSVLLYHGGSITQTGLIPTDSKSLLFKERVLSPQLEPLGLFLGGQSLSYATLFSGSSYTLYGADISSFAGQAAGLVFQAPGATSFIIDDIEFSPQMIPEPSFLALFCCGGLPLAVRQFRIRRH